MEKAKNQEMGEKRTERRHGVGLASMAKGWALGTRGHERLIDRAMSRPQGVGRTIRAMEDW